MPQTDGPQTPPKDQKSPRKKGWRKSEIIDMAALCFMERGYHATSVDEVADRLGCTKGRIYHYYASKTDLFFDVHREGMKKLFEAIEPAMQVQGDGLTVLHAMLLAHANAMLEHHTFENVVAQGVQIHRFDATTQEQRQTMQLLIDSRDRFEGLFKTQISNAIADHSVRDLDVSVTAKVLLGALQWSIFWYRARPGETAEDRDELAQKMVAPLIDGLRRI